MQTAFATPTTSGLLTSCPVVSDFRGNDTFAPIRIIPWSEGKGSITAMEPTDFSERKRTPHSSRRSLPLMEALAAHGILVETEIHHPGTAAWDRKRQGGRGGPRSPEAPPDVMPARAEPRTPPDSPGGTGSTPGARLPCTGHLTQVQALGRGAIPTPDARPIPTAQAGAGTSTPTTTPTISMDEIAADFSP